MKIFRRNILSVILCRQKPYMSGLHNRPVLVFGGVYIVAHLDNLSYSSKNFKKLVSIIKPSDPRSN
jgi:hypothetical protein